MLKRLPSQWHHYDQPLTLAGNSERILFLNEQYGNVVENKGPLWKTLRKAGMFLKRKHLAAGCGNVVEKTSVIASQSKSE